MEKTAPKKLGRPSTYDPATVEPILERIANGESLRKICDEDGMPNQSTIYDWLLKDEIFAKKYARAREAQAETLADEITALCDEEPERCMTDGGSRVDSGWVQWQRNRIDARKWIASKLLPKKYGEKVTNEHTGADGGPIQHQTVERRIVDPKAPA